MNTTKLYGKYQHKRLAISASSKRTMGDFMNKRTLHCLQLISLLCFLVMTPLFAQVADNLSVVQVEQTDSTVRGRTAYLTYKVTVNNSGGALTNVSAIVASQSRSIRVTKRSLQFNDFAANSSADSLDTFTIRVSSEITPDLSQLTYTFSAEQVSDQDTTLPTITANLSRPANDNGWHNQALTISFDCTDNIAVANCPSDILVNLDGEGQAFVGTTTDTSGNIASTEVLINLDTQQPDLQANLSNGSDTLPSDNATLLQRVSLNVISEAMTNLQIYQRDNADILLGELETNDSGEASLSDINLAMGPTPVLVRATDIADNVSEVNASIERLQCHVQPATQIFYITSPLSVDDSLSLLKPDNADFIGQYEQFKGNVENMIPVIPGFINNDGLTDWVLLDGNQFGVVIVLDSGNGLFNEGTVKLTGGSTATAAVLANLLDSEAIDLAVGHRDGTIAIFAGKGDGSFSENPVEVFNQSGAIEALQAADIDQDGDIDLLAASATQIQLYYRDNATTAQAVIKNGAFSNGLVGWQVEVIGHQPGKQAGVVSNSGNGAQLFENESFLTSLSQTFTPAQGESVLSFDLFSVFLDVDNGGIADAIEVSLLDQSKQSLVPTFRAQATSFLNIARDGNVSAASGVTYNAGNVQVDISAVDSPVSLYFDLIGSPPNNSSSFIVSNVDAGETLMVNNDYSSTLVDGNLSNVNGAVFCDAVQDNPPILVSDPGSNAIKVYQANSSGIFVLTTSLAQGEE
jgi:hypothetical protein